MKPTLFALLAMMTLVPYSSARYVRSPGEELTPAEEYFLYGMTYGVYGGAKVFAGVELSEDDLMSTVFFLLSNMERRNKLDAVKAASMRERKKRQLGARGKGQKGGNKPPKNGMQESEDLSSESSDSMESLIQDEVEAIMAGDMPSLDQMGEMIGEKPECDCGGDNVLNGELDQAVMDELAELSENPEDIMAELLPNDNPQDTMVARRQMLKKLLSRRDTMDAGAGGNKGGKCQCKPGPKPEGQDQPEDLPSKRKIALTRAILKALHKKK